MSLLLEIIPVICKRYPQVIFFICGDGPVKSMLEHVVRENELEAQVEIIGFVDFETVPQIHSSGDIFLNISISEAFCLAILEAACCEIYVISTNVGGISEILPPNSITLCEPKAESLIMNISDIIDKGKYLMKKDARQIIEKSYDWYFVAKQTLQVYRKVIS